MSRDSGPLSADGLDPSSHSGQVAPVWTRYPRYPAYTPRRDGGLGAYETVLARAGFAPVAGIDEAGRGACAGPLVVAAVVLDPASIRQMTGLADSKLLTPQAREEVYAEVLRRAIDWHVVVIGAGPAGCAAALRRRVRRPARSSSDRTVGTGNRNRTRSR